jgi:hypothetical protein
MNIFKTAWSLPSKPNDLIDGFTTRLENMESDAMDHDHSQVSPDCRQNGISGYLFGNELVCEMEFRIWTLKVCDMVNLEQSLLQTKWLLYLCLY